MQSSFIDVEPFICKGTRVASTRLLIIYSINPLSKRLLNGFNYDEQNDWCRLVYGRETTRTAAKPHSPLKELQADLIITSFYLWQQVLIFSLGPKVNLLYRLLLSSVLLIPLLSLCSYTVITSTSQHIRLYFPLQTLSCAYDSLLLVAWEHLSRAGLWASVGWFVLFTIHSA